MNGYITDIPTENRLFQILSERKYAGTLFHYTNGENGISICKTDTIWLTRIDYLEDLLEGSEILRFFKDVAEELYLGGMLEDNFYQIIKDFEEKDLGVSEGYAHYTACFTTEEDSYLMWKAYTEETEGCCIKFDTSCVNSNIVFVNVIYNKEEKRELVRRILLEINTLKGYYHETYIGLLNHMITTLRYVFKTKPFETEKEVRIIYVGHIGLEEKQNEKPHVELKLNANSGYNLTLGPRNHHSEEHYRKSIGPNLTKLNRSSIKLRNKESCNLPATLSSN